MLSYRHHWHRFTWKRYGEGTFRGAAPVTAVLREQRLLLTHSLAYLSKTFKDIASLTLASLAKKHQSFHLLSPLGHCHLGSTVATPATNCLIMEHSNITRYSTITLSRSCTSAGNETEDDEKKERFLLKGIPQITVDPPADGSTEHSNQTYDSESVPASQKRQGCKMPPFKIGSNQHLEPTVNNLNPCNIKKHADGTEQAYRMLEETGYVHSEVMLNCGSSGAKRDTQVLNKNKTEALSKREDNFKFSATNSLRATSALSLALIRRNSGLTQE
jgi:hypothetical protein